MPQVVLFPRSRRHVISLVLLLLTLPIYARAQHGAVTLPRNLADLTQRADRIVQGRVLSVHIEPAPGYAHLQTLLLTLAVDDVLKGHAEKQVTLRQFLWDLRDLTSNAGYRVGDTVLLFLNKPTSLGLVSPVGLDQGRFRVTRDAHAHLVATNGNNNAGLTAGLLTSGALNPRRLSASSRSGLQTFSAGPLPLDTLKESVHVLLSAPSGAAQ